MVMMQRRLKQLHVLPIGSCAVKRGLDAAAQPTQVTQKHSNNNNKKQVVGELQQFATDGLQRSRRDRIREEQLFAA
jgi:hypothetical protein